ncbi:MAG: hypothetical protein JST82_00635 [Bacteroidetes bacterium]|nr:hypothetical protein [Bacteroidota bacterium]
MAGYQIRVLLLCCIVTALFSCSASKQVTSDNSGSEQAKETQSAPAVSGRKAVTVNPGKDANAAERQDAGRGN